MRSFVKFALIILGFGLNGVLCAQQNNSENIEEFINQLKQQQTLDNDIILKTQAYGLSLEQSNASLTDLYNFYYRTGEVLIGRFKNPAKAKVLLLKALHIATKAEDKNKQAETKHWLAWVFFQQGQLEEAIRNFLDARELYIETGNKSGEANLVMHLGDFYLEMGDAHTAYKHYKESIELRPKTNNQKLLGFHYLNLGNSLIALDSFPAAEKALQKAEKLDDNPFLHQLILAYRGRILKLKGNIPEAINYYEAALPQLFDMDPGDSHIDFATDYAECLLLMGFPAKADSTCKKAISGINPSSLHSKLAKLYFVKSNALKGMGRIDESLSASNSAFTYLSNFAYGSGLTGVQNMLMAYVNARASKEKLELNATLERERYQKEAEKGKNNLVTIAGGGLLLLSIGLTFLAVNLKKSRRKLREQNNLLTEQSAALTNNMSLLESKEYRLRQILSRSNMGYCVVNREGIIIDINESMKPYTEVDEKENLVGKSVKAVFNEDIARMFSYTMTSIKHKPFATSEVEIVLTDQQSGKELLIVGSITNLLDDPTVNAFTFQATNVTSFVEAERYEKEVLRARIEMNQKEISKISSQYIANQNMLIEKTRTLELLEKELVKTGPRNRDELVKLIKSANVSSKNADKVWADFKMHFDLGFDGFYERLQQKHPNLTIQEQRHCAFIKMNMSSKETATVSGSSLDAVKKARTRLKKRINLPDDLSLYDYFAKL